MIALFWGGGSGKWDWMGKLSWLSSASRHCNQSVRGWGLEEENESVLWISMKGFSAWGKRIREDRGFCSQQLDGRGVAATVTAGKLMKIWETDGGEKPTKNEIVDLKWLLLPHVVLGLGFPLCHSVGSVKKVVWAVFLPPAFSFFDSTLKHVLLRVFSVTKLYSNDDISSVTHSWVFTCPFVHLGFDTKFNRLLTLYRVKKKLGLFFFFFKEHLRD